MKWNRHCILCSLIIFIMLLNSSCNLWNDLWGKHDLGHNLSLWDGDKEKDRIIVYCEGDCNVGTFVVPTYKRHMDSLGHYAEYVKEAVSDKKWVIAKTYQIKDKQDNYYIISKDFDISNLDCSKSNCDSILQSCVIGPMNLSEFENRKQTLNIDLRFK